MSSNAPPLLQVPSSTHKKELLEHLDRVPTYVQQLQFTVKNSTVGKAATFTKVDNVIHETKNLMNVISKVVTTCFVCATKVSQQSARLQRKVLAVCGAMLSGVLGGACVYVSAVHAASALYRRCVPDIVSSILFQSIPQLSVECTLLLRNTLLVGRPVSPGSATVNLFFCLPR